MWPLVPMFLSDEEDDAAVPTANYQPLGESGGQEYDEVSYNQERLRADLCELAQEISFQHGAKIVSAILEKYEVRRRRAGRQWTIEEDPDSELMPSRNS